MASRGPRRRRPVRRFARPGQAPARRPGPSARLTADQVAHRPPARSGRLSDGLPTGQPDALPLLFFFAIFFFRLTSSWTGPLATIIAVVSFTVVASAFHWTLVTDWLIARCWTAICFTGSLDVAHRHRRRRPGVLLTSSGLIVWTCLVFLLQFHRPGHPLPDRQAFQSDRPGTTFAHHQPQPGQHRVRQAARRRPIAFAIHFAPPPLLLLGHPLPVAAAAVSRPGAPARRAPPINFFFFAAPTGQLLAAPAALLLLVRPTATRSSTSRALRRPDVSRLPLAAAKGTTTIWLLAGISSSSLRRQARSAPSRQPAVLGIRLTVVTVSFRTIIVNTWSPSYR